MKLGFHLSYKLILSKYQLKVIVLSLTTSLVQENLIRDDNKLVLLASLSDSLEYVADSIERQVLSSGLSWYLDIICNACEATMGFKK